MAGILATVCLLYGMEEWLLLKGKAIPFLSDIVRRAKRPGEKTRIDPGPFLLAAGVVLPYLLFPLRVGHVALLQVCLADAGASLAGTYFAAQEGLPSSRRKTFVGSLAFWLIAYLASGIYFPWWQALVIACVGTTLESLPFPHVDNLTVPLGVAVFVMLMGWG